MSGNKWHPNGVKRMLKFSPPAVASPTNGFQSISNCINNRKSCWSETQQRTPPRGLCQAELFENQP